jgi:hypothetical protein
MSRHRPSAAAGGLVLLVTLTGCTSPDSSSGARPPAGVPTSTAQPSIADVAAQPRPLDDLTGDGTLLPDRADRA